MRILWLKADFLHPTTKGGQIRTLEMLRRLSRENEIHYVAYADAAHPEAVARSAEYCARAYPVEHHVPGHLSPRFFAQLAAGVFSPLPVAVSRYATQAMRQRIRSLRREQRFDCLVCDFCIMAVNIDDLSPWVLFQHNVETMIWRRHVENAADPLRKWYLARQAERMYRFEGQACRSAAHTVAVSPVDAQLMREMFGAGRVSDVPTGVDVESFTPAGEAAPRRWDLVFVGSMDWLPNIDGVRYFVREVLPLIRRRRPECSLVLAGRDPAPEIQALAQGDARITVTGRVPDVRPYLWGARVSIVPLRIGGGTRLKIYESMAARVPVVSTTIGAEGLEVDPPRNIRLADDAEAFAAQCLELLEHPAAAGGTAEAAWNLVAERFSWEQVTCRFQGILEQTVRHAQASS